MVALDYGPGFNAPHLATRRVRLQVTTKDKRMVKFLKQQEAKKLTLHTLLNNLKSCSIQRDIEWGRKIHWNAVQSRHDSNLYVVTALIRMYAKCGSMGDASRMFHSLYKPDVVCWNVLLLGYAENGDELTALSLFSRMTAIGFPPNSGTKVAALKACMSLVVKQDQGECLKLGREIHAAIGNDLDGYVQSALIDMYARCRSLVEARQVFDSILEPDVVCWNVLLLGYAEHGEGTSALELFSRMKTCECMPDSVTYVAALKACTSLAVNGDMVNCLKQGRRIHSEIGRHLNHYVQNTLIDMYSKCGSMVDARHVFDSIQNPNVVSWSALLLGYAEVGEGHATLELFSRMKTSGCAPNSVTYVGVLRACGLTGALSLGRKFHSDISEFTPHVVTCLVDFYAKCGSMIEACEVFDLHSRLRVVPTWNALLAGYGSFGDTSALFNFFEAMRDQGFQPDAMTFVCILSCCSHAGFIEKARAYFKAMPLQYGITPSVQHYTCIIDVLGRGNRMNEAIDILRKMPCLPDAFIWTTLLGACRKWRSVEIGRLAFQSLMAMGETDASAYVLMAQIYGSRDMREEKEWVLEKMEKFETHKLPDKVSVGKGTDC